MSHSSVTSETELTRLPSLLRLRQELDKLLLYQSSKIPDQAKQRAFLQTHYEELLAGLSVSSSARPSGAR